MENYDLSRCSTSKHFMVGKEKLVGYCIFLITHECFQECFQKTNQFLEKQTNR